MEMPVRHGEYALRPDKQTRKESAKEGLVDVQGLAEASKEARAEQYKRKILHEAQERYGELSKDDARYVLLKRVYKRILSVVDGVPEGEVRFLQSPEVNAFVVRSDKDVFVFDGLLRKYTHWCKRNGKIPTEDAVAFVVAHEVGHIQQGSQEVDVEEDGKDAPGGNRSEEAKQKHQRRLNDEYDADRFGLLTMAAAGYNPREGLEMLQFLRGLHDGINLPMTHPRSDDRGRELTALVESPDTIMQNTDQPVTPFERGLEDELSQEDKRRPGTALYRGAAKDRLEEFVQKAERITDVLEVVQVAQMHRSLKEVNRLRHSEDMRGMYAKWIVVENVRVLVGALSEAYGERGSYSSSELVLYPPTETTRYLMREYGLASTETEDRVDLDPLDDDLVAMTTSTDNALQFVKSQIDQEIESLEQRSTESQTAPQPIYTDIAFARAEEPDASEYLEKLRYIRANIDALIETVDHAALSPIAHNVELNPKKTFVKDESVSRWVGETPVQDLLEWCKSSGTPLFSELSHTGSTILKRAVGDAATVDSRYQSYLPKELTAQEDFSSAEGRAAFLEQSLFHLVHEQFVRRKGWGGAERSVLERTSAGTRELALALKTRLEERYAAVANAGAIAEAMADALLTTGAELASSVESTAWDFSVQDAQAWLDSVREPWLEYKISADAFFANETGIAKPASELPLFDAYNTLSALESRCAHIARQILERQGKQTGGQKVDELVLAMTLGTEQVARDARYRLVDELSKQSWKTASAAELHERLDPILRQLTQKQRHDLLVSTFASLVKERSPNLPDVLEFAASTSGELVKYLLEKQWEAFQQIPTERRVELIGKFYEDLDQNPKLIPVTHGDSRIAIKVASEFIALVEQDKGPEGFLLALERLADLGVAHGGKEAQLLENHELQKKLEQLSDQQMLRLAARCKVAERAGKFPQSYSNSFLKYVDSRVLRMYGVVDFDPGKRTKFDTSRPFAEVFGGISKHMISPYRLLEDCRNAYGKTPYDVANEGLASFYPQIEERSQTTVGELSGMRMGGIDIDFYASIYHSSATPFYESHHYKNSPRREAVAAYAERRKLTTDRSKTPMDRMRQVLELIPEKTDFRDVLLAEIEEDMLKAHGLEQEGHRVVIDRADPKHKATAAFFYAFYRAAIPTMVDQARMQLWGRRAEALYKEHLAPETTTLNAELARLRQIFPAASFARDEALLQLGNTELIRTPEQARQVQSMLSEMQRQTENTTDLSSQSQLERFNTVIGLLSRSEKRDFILWTIGAVDQAPKSVRAYGALNAVSLEAVPQFVFAATAQEREQFFLRLFVGDNGIFEPQNAEDQAVLDAFIDETFGEIFPDDATDGVVGKPREILQTVFKTVFNEYDPYRRGKIFIGMVEAMQGKQGASRGEKIVALMAELGPVFIKVGQVLSETESAPGKYLLGEDVRQPMKRLKQSAKRFHRLAAVFSLEASGEFKEDNPNRIVELGETLAAASIKQVNEAERADGKQVVEKVLRPSIEKHLAEDVRVLGVIIERLRKITTVPRGIEEVGATYVKEESDFAREVANTRKIGRALETYRSRAVVRNMPTRTTRVYNFSKTHIQEERVRGISLEELTQIAQQPDALEKIAEKHGLSEAEKKTYTALAADVPNIRLQAFDALAFQYFQADAFHSDPHAGNFYITPDKNLVMIDNGSIGETKQTDRNNLKRFFLGFALKQPTELRAAVKVLARGIDERHVEEVVAIAQSSLGDADKMNKILVTVTENTHDLDPAFDKFLKSFATGAYLVSGLKPDDVRTVLAAYTQGDSGSLRSYAATTVARAVRDYPNSIVGQVARKMIGS